MRFLTTTQNRWINLIKSPTVKAFPGVQKPYQILFYELNPGGNYRYGHRMDFDTSQQMHTFLVSWLKVR